MSVEKKAKKRERKRGKIKEKKVIYCGHLSRINFIVCFYGHIYAHSAYKDRNFACRNLQDGGSAFHVGFSANVNMPPGSKKIIWQNNSQSPITRKIPYDDSFLRNTFSLALKVNIAKHTYDVECESNDEWKSNESKLVIYWLNSSKWFLTNFQ